MLQRLQSITMIIIDIIKVLFLDIDGVLNSTQYQLKNHHRDNGTFLYHSKPANSIDPEAVTRLNKIVQNTNCKIVISSTWRLLYGLSEIRGYLKERGFEYPHYIIDRTTKEYAYRGIQIQEWLDYQKKRGRYSVSNIAIVDDDSDMEHLSSYLVKTSHDEGLTDNNADALIEMLNKMYPENNNV